MPVATIISRANLPLDGLPRSQMIAFRDPASGEEHVAPGHRRIWRGASLIRLSSRMPDRRRVRQPEMRCDPQLRGALRTLGEAGGGVLLHLRQGRAGIGLDKSCAPMRCRTAAWIRSMPTGLGSPTMSELSVAGAMTQGVGSTGPAAHGQSHAGGGLERGGDLRGRAGCVPLPTNPHSADYIAKEETQRAPRPQPSKSALPTRTVMHRASLLSGNRSTSPC